MEDERVDAEEKEKDKHWGWLGFYILVFSIFCIGDAGWLVGRYRGGDKPPHTAMILLCWYILALSITTLLFFFIYMMGTYGEKKIDKKGLWMCFVSWSMWMVAAVGLTTIYRGSYNCSSTKFFPHCSQAVTLQVFCWFLVGWITLIPLSNEDRPPNRINRERRNRATAPEALEEGRRDIQLKEIRGEESAITNEERNRALGPPGVTDEDRKAPNLWSLPGPPDPKPSLAA